MSARASVFHMLGHARANLGAVTCYEPGVFARAGAVVISGMLVVFIVFIAQALVRGIDLRCGCFGGDELASWWTVARDVAMLIPALLVARQPAAAAKSP